MILRILFIKTAKTPAKATATLCARAFFLSLLLQLNLLHYPDANPGPALETKQKKTSDGTRKQKETAESKRKETPTTTSMETTIITKIIKIEGSGSCGRVWTSDFDELRQSIIKETISIYCAQIGGVKPFPERSDDHDTVKQAWIEVCTGQKVKVDLEDIFKLVRVLGFLFFLMQ